MVGNSSESWAPAGSHHAHGVLGRFEKLIIVILAHQVIDVSWTMMMMMMGSDLPKR